MFKHRATEIEFLDSDPSEHLAMQSYRFMALVNRLFGGTGVAKDFIARQLAARTSPQPLKILDIGSGSCDIPLAIAKWACRHKHNVEFTCVEPNPYAIALAKKRLAAHPNLNIKIIKSDIFTYKPTASFDCAMGSMFFHHFDNVEILKLLVHIRTLGIQQVLINDLHRCRKCYTLCKLIAVFASADVRHDALLSIRRSFQPDELRRLLAQVPKSAAVVETKKFCRISAVISFSWEARP